MYMPGRHSYVFDVHLNQTNVLKRVYKEKKISKDNNSYTKEVMMNFKEIGNRFDPDVYSLRTVIMMQKSNILQ